MENSDLNLAASLAACLFSSISSIRRGAAQLAVQLAFVPEAEKAVGGTTPHTSTSRIASSDAARGDRPTLLPALFLGSYSFPCATAPLHLRSVLPSVEGSFPANARVLSEHKRQVCSVLEQRGQLAGGSRADDRVADPATARIQRLDCSHLADECIEQLRIGGSPVACRDALSELHRLLRYSIEAASALASGTKWQAIMKKLLQSSPTTADDFNLWLQLIPCLRILGSNSTTMDQLAWILDAVSDSAPALITDLRQPKKSLFAFRVGAESPALPPRPSSDLLDFMRHHTATQVLLLVADVVETALSAKSPSISTPASVVGALCSGPLLPKIIQVCHATLRGGP